MTEKAKTKKEDAIKKEESKIVAKEETEKKVEAKKETKKEVKKEEIKKEEVKKIKDKKKYIPYVKKENKKKSKEAFELMKKLKLKKKHPVFRGRFGKKNIRRKSIAKWDKWRLPQGIDLDKGREHGRQPRIGYRSQKEIRGVHPSGYKEFLVCNFNDLKNIDVNTQAIRFSATIGKRKKNELVKKANEMGAWILN